MIEKHFHDIFFNGKALSDFGLHCTGKDTFNSPEKDYETVEIPGRNGDLHIFNNRFKNVDLTYKVFIAGDEWISGGPRKDFHLQMQNFRAWMLHSHGYKKLEDTYHPDEYRKALFKGPIETEAIFLRAGEFDLTFNCMPQRFLKSGDKTFVIKKSNNTQKDGEIENVTLFEARPFIRLYGKGRLTIGEVNVDVSSDYTNPYIDIDCDIQDAYYNDINCNKYITLYDGEFFTLKPGANPIKLGTGITKIEIIPRWWTV